MWLLIKLSLSLALSLIVANNGAPMLLWHVDRNADMVGWTFIKDRASYREKVVATSRDKKEVSASRVILPDAKLSALLKFDAKTSKDPMTYFRLPQYLKSHFIKSEEIPASA